MLALTLGKKTVRLDDWAGFGQMSDQFRYDEFGLVQVVLTKYYGFNCEGFVYIPGFYHDLSFMNEIYSRPSLFREFSIMQNPRTALGDAKKYVDNFLVKTSRLVTFI